MGIDREPDWRRHRGHVGFMHQRLLAPEVVKAILRDCHPLELTLRKLAGDTCLPIAWQEQHARLGIV